MKARTRFYSSALSVALLFLIYLFCGSLRIRYRKAIGQLPDRIVIFGDESSAIPSTAGNGVNRRHSERTIPSTWASNLCQSLRASCDSFAPIAPSRGFVGSVIDNIVFNTSSPDLRDQVDRWIEFEINARKSGHEAERSSLFALFFGTNDVWELSFLDRADAISAVEASLDSMFEQIGRVASHWADPIQVLVPTAIDVTMLPAWSKYRLKNDTTGADLRNAVFVTHKWNEGLMQRATRWKAGTVMLWDAGHWFIDTLRTGRWQDVRQPCLEEHGGMCKHPEKYLMWDDLHLGPRAHEIMANSVVKYLLL